MFIRDTNGICNLIETVVSVLWKLATDRVGRPSPFSSLSAGASSENPGLHESKLCIVLGRKNERTRFQMKRT